MWEIEISGLHYNSASDALEALLAGVRPVGLEPIDALDSAGRILAQTVATDRPSPAADVSAMDGYALRMSDLGGGPIPVAGEIRIGHAPPVLPEGRTLRIVTGAPVPQSAEVVVKREDVEEGPSIVLRPGVAERLQSGQHIRRAGENAPAGTTVLEPGQRLTAGGVAAIASFCSGPLQVHRALRVHVIVTGDELIERGGSPSSWQLRDSNGPVLEAMLNGLRPWIGRITRSRAEDDLTSMTKLIADALDTTDALVLTGGVSMGDHDHVPAALHAAGATTVFHKLPQRPGKPVLGALGDAGQPILAFPGNPLSVMVTARRMGVAALARRAGWTRPTPPACVTLEEHDGKSIPLWWNRLVAVRSPGRASLVSGMGSGDIPSAAQSDGFIEMPPNETSPGPWPFYPWIP